MTTKKILLLGGTGYLGSNIAKHFSSVGCDVFCIVRANSDISFLKNLPRVCLISNDLTQINITFEQEHIDWVISSVCSYNPNKSLYRDMFESNVNFPPNVLSLAIKHNVKKFMSMGTGLPNDFNAYSFTKAKFADFGKFFSQTEKINFLNLKLEMFYGGCCEPDSRFLKMCRMKLLKGEPLDLTEGVQERDIVRVEDILKIMELLMSKDLIRGYKELPIGSDEQHSIREIVEFMKKTLNSSSKLNFGMVSSRNDEPSTKADIAWYDMINFKLQYSCFDGLQNACMDDLAKINLNVHKFPPRKIIINWLTERTA